MKLYGYGYVKEVKDREKFTAVKMSCYDGKDKDGTAKYYLLSVRIFNSQDGQKLAVSPGQMLYLDGADLSIYKYDEKWYTEARINKMSCWVKGEPRTDTVSSEGVDNDSIPF